MFKKTNNKMEAIRAYINWWLKVPGFYCNNCGNDFDPLDTNEEGHWKWCCEKPEVGRNKDHCRGVIKQNKMLRETRKNNLAQMDNKALRFGISLPTRLYHDLTQYFSSEYQEKLFNDQKELHRFMREFPQFCIPKRV